MRLALLIVLVAGEAGADATVHLKMKQVDGTNLHIANEGGAIHWNDDTTVTVDLLAGHKVTAASAGTRTEHNLYVTGGGASYNTDETTTWRTVWTGTWAQQGDTLTFDLVLGGDTCKHEKVTTGAPPEKLACTVPAKRVRVACASEDAEVEDLAGKVKKVAAWSCSGSDEVGEGPRTWLLGKTTCIARARGHMHGDHLGACTP